MQGWKGKVWAGVKGFIEQPAPQQGPMLSEVAATETVEATQSSKCHPGSATAHHSGLLGRSRRAMIQYVGGLRCSREVRLRSPVHILYSLTYMITGGLGPAATTADLDALQGARAACGRNGLRNRLRFLSAEQPRLLVYRDPRAVEASRTHASRQLECRGVARQDSPLAGRTVGMVQRVRAGLL